MDVRRTAQDVVFRAIDELNKQLPVHERLIKSADTALAGNGHGLDSLGLVNLIVITEQKIEEAFNVELSLADDLSSPEGTDSFRSISCFIDHVCRTLEAKLNG